MNKFITQENIRAARQLVSNRLMSQHRADSLIAAIRYRGKVK